MSDAEAAEALRGLAIAFGLVGAVVLFLVVILLVGGGRE